MDELIANYMYTSSIVVLTYDVLLNMEKEIQYIWRSSLSIPKILFIFSRYYPLSHNIISLAFFSAPYNGPTGEHVCQVFLWYHGFGGLILIVPILNLIFFLRVSALYGHNRRIVSLFVLLFIGEFICEFITTFRITILEAEDVVTIPSIAFPGKHDCDTVDTHRHLSLLAWIPTTFNSTLLCSLTLFKLWTSLNKEWPLYRMFESSPLYAALFIDGALYFLLVFVSNILISIGDGMLFGTNWGIFASYFQPWYIAIYSLSSSRLILNLRRVAAKDSTIAIISSPLQFATLTRHNGEDAETREGIEEP